jgi:hypothetical protein
MTSTFRRRRLAFDLAADGGAASAVVDRAGVVPDHAALGEDVGAGAAPRREGAGDHLLGAAQAVDGGGVDPVHPHLQGLVDGRDGRCVVLFAPAIEPGAADGP